jgi:hypothetical protein
MPERAENEMRAESKHASRGHGFAIESTPSALK